MTLQLPSTTPPADPDVEIALDDVNTELGNSATAEISLDDSALRGLTPNSTWADALHGTGINTTSGTAISMSELYGASAQGNYDSLNRSAASVNEGNSITFTVSTTDVADGTTVGYTVTGISSADLSSGSLTGSITINSDTGSVTFGIAADNLTEGSETLTITLAATDSAGDSTGSLSSTAVINDTSLTPLSVSISGVLNGSVTGCYNTTITSASTSTATTSVSGGSGGYTYYWEVVGGVYNTSGMVATASSFTNGRYASSNGATITGYASPVSSSGSSGSTYVPNIRVTVTDSIGNTATASTTGSHSFSWHPAAGYVYYYYCSGNDEYYVYATDNCGNTASALYQTCSPSCLNTLTVYTIGNFNASVSGSAGSNITATSGSVGAIFGGSSGGTTFQWSLDSYTESGVTAIAASFGSGQSQFTTGSVTATRATAGSGYVDVNVSVTVTDNCGRTATGYATGRLNFTFT
jgi:hypothetical protein